MKSYETLLVEVKEQILFITVNRPEKLNALSTQVLSELKDVMLDLDSKIRGVILTGAGEKAFIAGADIAAMAEMTPQQAEAFSRLGQEVPELFEKAPVPVIACVNGFALGGGNEMAMGCDFIYATHTASFGQPEVNLGLIPAFGGTQRLMSAIGPRLSRELIYTGKAIVADEAMRIGLVSKTFGNKEEMIQGAVATLELIKQKSPIAIAKAKEVMRLGADLVLRGGLEQECKAFTYIFDTEDKREGVDAFLNKRKPNFSGQ
jgi:enoyl-CoA hydratase